MAQVYAPTSKVYEPTEIGSDVLGDAKARGEALATEQAAPVAHEAPQALVTVIAPDGKAYGLPAAQVPAALEQGYQVESEFQKAVRQYKDEHKGLSGDMINALDGAANEATFGVLGAATEANETPLERAKREALKADHKIAHAVGSLAGFGATFLYGGEFFGGASAAGKGVEGAILGEKVAGEAVGQTLARLAPEGAAEAATKLGPSFAKQLVAAGAGTAVEGMVLAAPKALTEATFGDPNQAAETLLYGAGGGAILGLAGPVASKLKKVATEGFAGGLGLAAEDGGKSFLGKMADKQAFRSLASNQASLGLALKKAKGVGGAEGVGETLNELGLIRRVGEAPEAYAERLAAAKAEWGDTIGGLTEKLDTLGATPDATKIYERIRAEIIAPLKKKPGFESIQASVEKYLDSFASKSLATEEGLTFTRMHEMRASLDDLVYRETRAASPVVEELRKVRAVIEDEFTKQGDAAAKAAGEAFLEPWKKAKLTYGRLSAAEAGAEDYVLREAKNRVLSPTDYGTGFGGAILSAATGSPLPALGGIASGIGHHLLRTEGNGLLARGLNALDGRGLLSIEQAMKFSANRLDEIPVALGSVASGAASKGIDAGLRAGLDTADTHAWNSLVANKTDEKSFTKMSDDLATLASDPAKMQAKLAELTEPYQDDAPAIAAALATKATEVVMYLNAKRPKPPEAPTPFQKINWKANDQQMQDFGRRVATIMAPYSAIARVLDKTIGAPEIETLHAIYPRLYEAMRKRVMEFGMTGKGQDLSYGHRIKLSLFLDMPIDTSMGFLKEYQATFQAESATGSPSGGALGVKSGILKPPALGTDVQRVSAK